MELVILLSQELGTLNVPKRIEKNHNAARSHVFPLYPVHFLAPNAAQPQCLNPGYDFFVRNFCVPCTEVADKKPKIRLLKKQQESLV
ncbi:MAG TPA: hypothetical protein PKO36_12925 [Candidatus Hydrogenedentes bacterium]|nr:hypothetical protein [Candidatus Hydrogenedentota bacterium]